MFRVVFNNSRVILAPRLREILSQPRCLQSTGEDDKTITRVLNQEVDAGLMVDAYSQIGFRLNNGMSVVGPIAIFPKTVLSWRVQSSKDITEDSLSLFSILEPKIDILIIGVGDKGEQVNPRVIKYMRNKGISIEILPTESACTTFNFLNDERRYVAAALIPPISMRSTDDDLVRTQVSRNRLFVSQDEESWF